MNNKVCVELIVPSIEERYDVFLPVSKNTLETIYLLSKAINEMSDGNFPISNKISLMDVNTGVFVDMNKTIYENKILNGTKLVLI